MTYFSLFRHISLFITTSLISAVLFSQGDIQQDIAKAAANLKLREIGPAVMGGRIADIAVSPTDPSTWYVAVGSGNLWKTTNRGITWKPIFDNQSSYSIGTVSIDPNNSEVIWVGTGENVSGRHVGWGDGIYKSENGGKTWDHMGLKKSEHIGKILIDPRNSNVIMVAAEGPLWSPGGERGLYRSEDGGKTWEATLSVDQNTGVTDIECHPTNPDVVYAAAYQRRRHTWSLMAGGPKSGIYKSTDNGVTWKKLKTGLPKGDMGKIGLAVTPANPEIVYATIEAGDKEKGFYKSMNRGESWEKRSSYTSGGTGPHYYQEIEASPVDADLVYQMDVFIHITKDGGKNFKVLGTGREKHSDNHALWIDPENSNHLLAGTDAGLYETFDGGHHYRHFPNMPISQFYKLGLDNSEPFYNIVGGAQDLGTLIGPSRTMNIEGVRNQDWFVPLGADGYESQFDPEDPNTAYMEIQQGLLHRYDKITNEVINIQPQPADGDAPERWNWDSPIIISPHNHERLYFGSQRLWKSDNRGNSWIPISEDLTTNTNRYELELMDRVWSIDDLYDTGAMSKYATLTAISESPKMEGLLYTGSDDGLVQVSENGGETWRKSGTLPDVPERSFINDVEASTHNEDVVFVAADAHKLGDYKPYLFVSNNRGQSWKSITGDLPEQTIVWSIKQDHEDENLLFIGTEYGLYFSYNMGTNWIKLKGGVPTIPFRDIELHQRDGDVVGATFGRGFYVLDDYTALRSVSDMVTNKENAVFPIRDAWLYVPNVPMQAKEMPTRGSSYYTAENPPYGALITYYVSDIPKTQQSVRKESEKEARKNNTNPLFPGYESLQAEAKETEPQVILLIKDANDNPVRWIKGTAKKGLHRTNWDLKLPAPNPINLSVPSFRPPWASEATGPLAGPGTYTVEMYVEHDGKLEMQGTPQSFTVKTVHDDSSVDYIAIASFQRETSELMRDISSAGRVLSEAGERLRFLHAAMQKTPKVNKDHFSAYASLTDELYDLRMELYGDSNRGKLNESSSPSISGKAGSVAYGHWETTQPPTETFSTQLESAKSGFSTFKPLLDSYLQKLESFEKTMQKAGAPYTRGRSW